MGKQTLSAAFEIAKRKRGALWGGTGKNTRFVGRQGASRSTSKVKVRSNFDDSDDKLGVAFARMFDDPTYSDPYGYPSVIFRRS